MKNIIRILTLLLIVALSYAVFLSFQMRNDNIAKIESQNDTALQNAENEEIENNEVNNIELFNEIVSRDLTKDYPTSYMELLAYYNKTVEYLYGGTATEEQIKTLINIQRQLYSEEILILNSYEEQFAHAIEDIADFTANGNRIFASEIDLTDIYESNLKNSIVEMRVVYRVTRPPNTDMKYYLVKEENYWKILSFKLTEGEGVFVE